MRRQPLIIGAGPAGTAAAIRLGQAGYRPEVIERCAGPTDKVCGDFLGADAIELLRALGVDPVRLGAAPIHRLRLLHRDQVITTELPFPAFGLSRRLLDEAMLHQAQRFGARPRRGQPVQRIDRGPDSWQAHIGDSDPLAADAVFLATGKHDLRHLPRPDVTRGAVGMKMYYRLSSTQTNALAGTIALMLFPGGYAGLQCVEEEKSVLCVALSRARLQTFGGVWSGLLAGLTSTCPLLAALLDGAQPLLPRPLAVAGIPYGYLHRGSLYPRFGRPASAATADKCPHLFRLGDQAAVIPSLTGDGIAIALHSGVLAADTWLAGGDAGAYHHRLARDLGSQMRLAGLLHHAAMTGPLQAVAIRSATWFPGLLRQAACATRLRHLPLDRPQSGKKLRPH